MKNMKVLVSDFFGVVVQEMLPKFFENHVKDKKKAMEIKLSYSNPADIGEFTFEEELSRIAGDLGLPLDEVKEECYGYSKPIERMVKLLRECPFPVVLLSNAPEGLVESLIEIYGLDDLFFYRIISYKERKKKPEQEIYKAVYRYFDEKSDFLFVDDNKANLEAPNRLGWKTVQFKNDDPSFQAIEKWLNN